jgi:hypothetical protein
MKNISRYLSAACLAMALSVFLPSCTKDDGLLFEKASSVRVKEFQDNLRSVLLSAEEGWVLNLFPDWDRGGYAFTCRFDSVAVSIRSDLYTYDKQFKIDDEESGTYNILYDNGVTLVFDGFNRLLHHFSIPYANLPGTLGGDFEFVVDSVTDSLITVHGKISGITSYMRKLSVAPEKYLSLQKAKIEDLSSITVLEGTLGTEPFEGRLDPEFRLLKFTAPGDSVETSVPYVFTTEGIELRDSLRYGGVDFSALSFDYSSGKFSGLSSDGSAISISGRRRPNYTLYEDFVYGNGFKLKIGTDKAHSDSLDVEVNLYRMDLEGVPGFLMAGLNPNYNIFLSYNKAYGWLEWKTQQIGEATLDTGEEVIVLLCPANTASGITTRDLNICMAIEPDPNAPAGVTRMIIHGNGRQISGDKGEADSFKTCVSRGVGLMGHFIDPVLNIVGTDDCNIWHPTTLTKDQ